MELGQGGLERVQVFFGTGEIAGAAFLFESEGGVDGAAGTERGDGTLQAMRVLFDEPGVVGADGVAQVREGIGIVSQKKFCDFAQQIEVTADAVECHCFVELWCVSVHQDSSPLFIHKMASMPVSAEPIELL